MIINAFVNFQGRDNVNPVAKAVRGRFCLICFKPDFLQRVAKSVTFHQVFFFLLDCVFRKAPVENIEQREIPQWSILRAFFDFRVPSTHSKPFSELNNTCTHKLNRCWKRRKFHLHMVSANFLRSKKKDFRERLNVATNESGAEDVQKKCKRYLYLKRFLDGSWHYGVDTSLRNRGEAKSRWFSGGEGVER